MTQDYYVYVLCDPRRPGEFKYGKWKFSHEPFYVGKGKGGRAQRHFLDYIRNSATQNYNTRKINRIAKIHTETGLEPIVRYHRGLTEDRAYDLEARVVAKIGRGRHGPLLNLSDGGLGGNGVARQAFTPERSAAMSALLIAKAAEKGDDYWKAQGSKTREYWAKLKETDPAEYERLCSINAKCTEARWSKPGAKEKQSEGQRAIINARYANMTDIERAKLRFKQRLGHLLRRFQSEKKKASVKEVVYAFIERSRHKLPERFERAAEKLLAQYNLV